MTARSLFDVLYMDTAHMKSIFRENSFNHTLILVDCCTKYVALELLTTKNTKEVAIAMVKVFNRLS
jgi:adenosyl cobinamide kinase/adenosyl cobinamide phosphate guanylyltransferase